MGIAWRIESPVQRSRKAIGYALWLKIAIVTLLVGILYFAVLTDLVNDWWTEPNLSQGFLIPPFALYVFWLRRKLTFAHPAVPDSRGLWLTGLACFLFVLGKLGAEFFLPRISFVILLAGFTWTFWGARRLRTLTFPFLLLATMVPLPVIVYNSLAAPLQLFASDVATRLAQLAGVTVYRDGNIIQLAGMSLGVEEACSGLNSLSALMVASLLLGFLVCTGLKSRLVLFALSFPLSVGVNVFRVTATAIIADYYPPIALGFYHSFSGWLVFLAGFGVLYGVAKALHILLDRKTV
jgi:exosortase